MEETIYKCTECEATFPKHDVQTTTVYEDWGDVVCWVCPNCGQIDYEGRDMIVPVEE